MRWVKWREGGPRAEEPELESECCDGLGIPAEVSTRDVTLPGDHKTKCASQLFALPAPAHVEHGGRGAH